MAAIINNTSIDGIVDTGTNSNGTYIKYSNGIMICTKVVHLTGINITEPWGTGLFTTSSRNDIDLGYYAEPFIEVPVVVATCHRSSAHNSWVPSVYNCNHAHSGYVSILRGSAATNVEVWIKTIAIGKYK